MDKLIRIFSTLDWVVGGITVLVGLYLLNGWVIASGALGLLAAYYKPAQRIKTAMEKKLLRKKAKVDDSTADLHEDAFYAHMLSGDEVAEHAAPEATMVAHAPRTYHDALPGYGVVYLSPNKHNQLKQTHLRVPTEKASASPFF